MTIIKRADLGRPLTWDELDNNFAEVDSLVSTASAAVQTATTQAEAASEFADTASTASQEAQDAATTAGSAASAAVAGIYSDFASTEPGKGASLSGFIQDAEGSSERTVMDKSRDVISVLDFVPSEALNNFANGIYNPLSSIYSNISDARAVFSGVSDLELTDTIEYAAIQQADIFARIKRRMLVFPAGHFLITKTIIKKAPWTGQYCTNAWSADGSGYVWDGTGTVLSPYGGGNPSRWTDVDGSDSSNYKPMIVSGRSGLSIEKMTLRCIESLGVWSTGLFFPGVRRQISRDFDSMGAWLDGGIRVDATWSNSNTTLTSLHPEIESDVGCNEYLFDNCFLTGVRSHVIQGTTRSSTTTPFVWSPGGTSDINFSNCRFGNDGDVTARTNYGAAFRHDAVIDNTAGAGQGINFINCTLRVAAKYALDLNHTNRLQMVNTYAETTSSWLSTYGAAINSCTSDTSNVSLLNDTNGLDWYKDGVLAGSGSLIDWYSTKIVSKLRGDGRLATPNLFCSASSSDPLKIVSRSGVVAIYSDDGTTQSQFMLIGSGGVRPTSAGGVNLGTTSFPFGNVIGQSTRATASFLPQTDNSVPIGTSTLRISNSFVVKRSWTATVFDAFGTGSPEGSLSAGVGSTYRRTDGGALTSFYVKESGTGNTGWVAK